MATESETTSLHTPATATSPDEPMKTNVNEQVELKTMEQETVSLPEKGKEENPKIDELPNKTKPLSKMEGEAENKRTEPPAVEVKIDDSSTMDALVVEDKIEVKQDIPHSHAHSGPEAAGDAVESQQVAQPAIEEAQEEQPATASVEKLQDKQTTIVGVLESSTEAAQKPKELSAVLPTKESEEVAVKDPEDSEAVSKEVNKQESLVSEVHVKVQEQSEVTEQGGKQDPEDSEVVSKEVNKQESLFSEAGKSGGTIWSH
ncbi:hypothetical protein GH714_006556 [Hevea brasiliensis]|uniref:Uncharacterized protein n=1 Tax=Hevea brasiliensis TaxID=3981 RepID=A0A6A6NG20_HEVBR|nr:hypothetical protein GH714_006556 [Hevea brasiliensis]